VFSDGIFKKMYNPKPASNKIILIAGMALSVALPVCFNIWLRHFKLNFFDEMPFSLMIRWGAVLFVFLYSYKVERQSLLIWKGNDNGIGFTLLSVPVLYMLYIIAGLISIIPSLLGFHETYAVSRTMDQLLQGHPIYIFIISLTAGVTEELVFRGYLLTRLSDFFKEPHIPVIISSGLFAIMHYGYHSLMQLLDAFFFGVFFSVFYIKYRNIHALIIAHFLIDLIAFS
jgi:membrane protease YdiL (CAAX protease family)